MLQSSDADNKHAEIVKQEVKRLDAARRAESESFRKVDIFFTDTHCSALPAMGSDTDQHLSAYFSQAIGLFGALLSGFLRRSL
jgi:hypothetical protein